MNATQYPIKVLQKSWPIFGNKIMPGFKPDAISATVAVFFSDERAEKWPSLKHTPNKGLLLAGPKGIGKTINLRIYSKIACNDPNRSLNPRVISVIEIQENYKKEQEKGKGAEYLDTLANCPELTIDDIGNEDMKFNDYGTVRNLIADLLMLRYVLWQRGMVITHGTTNFHNETLEKLYDARLIDRMKEMFVYQVVKGVSKRSEPVKEIIEQKTIEEPALTEYEKRLIYLQGFAKSINDNTLVPFYDKGPMWEVLVKNQLIDPMQLESFDLINKATIKVQNDKLYKKSDLSIGERMEFDKNYSEEQEIDRLKKHMIMTEFFSTNTIDFTTYTPEQLL